MHAILNSMVLKDAALVYLQHGKNYVNGDNE